MQYINNNSDFALDIALKAILPDGTELATAPPNCDFTLTFGTRYDEAKYEVGRYNGEPRGYTVNTDGSLHVIFDAHGLGLGRLGCMLTYGIPDSSYPDGVATVVTYYELDVELIGWDADGQQSGTVTIATEAAAVGAAQQAQAAAERAAQAAEASQQAAQTAEAAAQASAAELQASATAAKGSESAAQAAAASSEASRQAAEQAAAQAQQARAAADSSAESAAQASTAAQASESAAQAAATSSAESATAAQNSAESAAAAVTAAQQAIDTANTAAAQATTAAQAANTAADNANTAADSASEYVERYEDIANSLPIVTTDFEGAENGKGTRYVIRYNKIVGIVQNGQPVYAPKGVLYTEATAPFEFTMGEKTFSVESGSQWTELNVEGITSLSNSFRDKPSLTSVSLCLDTSQTTNFSIAFRGCNYLSTLDISSLDVSNAVNMYSIFMLCNRLNDLKIGDWDTYNVTNFEALFYGCSNLKTIPEICAKFNTQNATTFSQMFFSCSELKELNLTNFDTRKVVSLGYTFFNCVYLHTLDISSFVVSSVTNVTNMFRGDKSLHTLKFPNMGQLKADTDYNKSIDLSYSPLDKTSLESIFAYDRTANGLTNPLTVSLSSTSKALLSDEDIAAITAKGYTIV